MAQDTNNGGAAGERIRSYVTRLDNLLAEKDEVLAEFREDIKSVYDEAAAEGFNKVALQEVIRLKRMAKKRGQSFVDDYDLYRHAAGLEGTPLDLAAERREREAAAPKAGSVVVTPNREADDADAVITPPPAKRLASPRKALPAPNKIASSTTH